MTTDPFAAIQGAKEEVWTSEAYFWDNSRRSDGRDLLVLQRTLDGAGFFEDVRGRKTAPPGHVMLFTHREPTKYGYSGERNKPYRLRFFNISMVPAITPLFRQLRGEFGSVLPMPDDSDATAIFNEIFTHYHQRTFRDRYHQSEMIYRLLAALYRDQMAAVHLSDPIEFGYYYLKNHFRSLLVLKSVANRCGITLEHFTRTFKACYGMPPGEILRGFRLGHADAILVATQLNINEIALASGFSGAHSFGRAYRAKFGCSPRRHA